jgi:hypothetical protein
MRSTQTILCLVTAGCLTLTPAYADSHAGPVAALVHAPAPQTTAKPTITGTGTSLNTARTTADSKTLTTHAPTHVSTTASSTVLNPIAQKIASHPQLASNVHALLPAGTTLNHATASFKNQGQFLAALHVSRNLGIPFSKLKADMTGDKHLSLGQSIQDLKPRANATIETRRAETEADHDVKRSTATTSLNPIARNISSHPQLAAKVQTLLPAGLTLTQASKGFRTEEQFLEALHVSKDLNIPFAQLKTEMTGTDHDSLGAAIQELKPGTNASAAVTTADREADADVKATTPQPRPQQGDTDGGDNQ